MTLKGGCMGKLMIWTSMLLIFAASVVASAQSNNLLPDAVAGERVFGSSLFKKPSAETRVKVPAPQAHPAKAEEGDILRVQTNLVVSDVLVYDQRGLAVKGLSRDDFRVEENGEPQQIEVFSFAGDGSAVSRSIVLVIDYSGSQSPYIDTSVNAAKVLVDMLHPNDKMAIVTDDIELLSDFTSDKKVLKEKLDALRTRVAEGKIGKSHQFSALLAVLNEMFGDGDLRPKIIFQTDGDEYGLISRRLIQIGKEKRADFSIKDITKTAERAGTIIYSILPGPDLRSVKGKSRREIAREELTKQLRLHAERTKVPYVDKPDRFSERFLDNWADSRERDSEAVARVATATGGFVANLETPQDAAAVYSRILAEMNDRYVIGYYPKNESRDGKRRTIKVTVNRPDHKIYGRTSYIAPRD
jgi:VWFA-related protein